MAWQCPNDGEALRGVNRMQRDNTVRTGSKRKVYECPQCHWRGSSVERFEHLGRKSMYMPRPGQYKGRKAK